MTGNGTVLTIITSGGVAAIFLAGLGAYVSLDERVSKAPTNQEVRQLIDDKTADKLAEITRRLAHIEQQEEDLITRFEGVAPKVKQR